MKFLPARSALASVVGLTIVSACAGGLAPHDMSRASHSETERTRPTALAREDRRTLPGTQCTLDFATRHAFLADSQVGRSGSVAGIARFFPLAQYSEPGAERFDWSAATLILPARANESKEQRLSRALNAWAKDMGMHVDHPSVEIVSEDARIWTFARDAAWTAKVRLELHGPYVVAVDSQYGPSGEAASERYVHSLRCDALSRPLVPVETFAADDLGLELEVPSGSAESLSELAPARSSSLSSFFTLTDAGAQSSRRRIRVGSLTFDVEVYGIQLATGDDAEAFVADALRARHPSATVERTCEAFGRATLLARDDADNARWYASAIVANGHVAILSVAAPAGEMAPETWLSIQHFLAQGQANALPVDEPNEASSTVAVLDGAGVEPALRSERGALTQCFARAHADPSNFAVFVNRGGDVASVTDGSDGVRSAAVDACVAPLLRRLHFAPGYTARVLYVACSRNGCSAVTDYAHDASHALAECRAAHSNQN